MSLAPIPKGRPRFVEHMRSIGRKETLHILRSPMELVVILLMPGFLTFLFGYAFEVGEVRQIRTLLVDEDGGGLATRIAAAMASDETFRVTREKATAAEARLLMDRDRYHVVVRIPAGTERLARGEGSAPVEVMLSGIDTVSAPTAIRALSQLLAVESAKLLALRLARAGLDAPDLATALQPLAPRFDVRYNPKLRFINYVMPGVIGLILQLVTVGLVAGALTREKELGTFEAILASPVRPLALLLGKTIPYLLVSLFEVATVLTIARAGFHVSLGGRAFEAMLLTLLFVLAALATGIFISTVTSSQAHALQATVFYCLPVFMLSGAYAPLNIIPEDVRLVSWLFPLTYYCRAFRDMSLKGLGLGDVWLDVALLAAYTVAAFGAARQLLEKRLG